MTNPPSDKWPSNPPSGPAQELESPGPHPGEPYFAPDIKEKRRKKLLQLVQQELFDGEFVAAHASCSNFRPLMNDLVITNCRILGLDSTGTKWEADLPAIAQIVIEPRTSNVGSSNLCVHMSDGREYTFKQVPSGMHQTLFTAATYRAPFPLPPRFVADREQQRASAAAQEQQREAARDRDWPNAVIRGYLGKRNSVAIHQHCRDGESPWFILGGDAGVLAAFADRLVISKSGIYSSFMAGSFGGGRTTTFFHSDINAIEYNGQIVNGVLEILTASYSGTSNHDFWRGANHSRNANAGDPFTLSNTLPLTKSGYKAALAEINELRDRISRSKSAQPVTLTSPSELAPFSVAQELASLGDLWREGVLTDEEFARAKARLLGSA